MGLRVVGAGLPRTGTTSLKAGLERLLGGRCYHMFELMQHVEAEGIAWWQALDGDLDALEPILSKCTAAVDWPASILWRELAERYPDTTVVLSHRGDADTWWRSADATVWQSMRRLQGKEDDADEGLFAQFNAKMRGRAGVGDELADAAINKAFYQRHFDEVVATIDPARLVIWQPSDGWGPLCDALDVPVPDEPFGHHNTTDEFRARAGHD